MLLKIQQTFTANIHRHYDLFRQDVYLAIIRSQRTFHCRTILVLLKHPTGQQHSESNDKK
jgi:hypothetical protein